MDALTRRVARMEALAARLEQRGHPDGDEGAAEAALRAGCCLRVVDIAARAHFAAGQGITEADFIGSFEELGNDIQEYIDLCREGGIQESRDAWCLLAQSRVQAECIGPAREELKAHNLWPKQLIKGERPEIGPIPYVV
jgi:hypothetical protein